MSDNCKCCNENFEFSFTDTVVIDESIVDVDVGTVTTCNPGSNASVEAVRAGDVVTFNFSIPRGYDGQNCCDPDTVMSDTSTAPVSNNVIKEYVDSADNSLSFDLYELARRMDSLQPGIPREIKTESDTVCTLFSNTLYVFPVMTSLSVSLSPIMDTMQMNEFHITFTSGSTPTTLTLPANIKGGISIAANRKYEISILENYLTYQFWSVS